MERQFCSKWEKGVRLGNTYSNCRVADCNNDGGYQKLFHENPKIGFLSHAKVFQRALDEGKVLAPAKNVAQMKQIIFNDYIDAALCGIFMIVVIAVLISALRIWIQVLRNKPMPLKEAPYIPRDESESRNYA